MIDVHEQLTPGFMQLLDGTRGDIFNPRPEFFEVRALAHSLASKNRWGGQSIGRITVTQHCVIVSRCIDSALRAAGHGERFVLLAALCGLLHELDEHLLPEVVSPLKKHPQMAWFRDLCELHMRVGAQWFGIEYPWPYDIARAIKTADAAACETEARDLTANTEWRRAPGVVPLSDRIVPLDPDVAEAEFLDRFEFLSMALEVA